MSDNCSKKQVKVDNWGMFFLQRLQQHFGRNEFCDFTLQFSNNENIKAHRLVLDVCTEYFQMLEKQGLVKDNVINMPDDMSSDVVIPVINFMYTGRLEFRADIQERLYLTAQKMKMTVLTKLLDAQSMNVQQLAMPSKSADNKIPVTKGTPKRTLPPGTFTNLQGKKISPRFVDPNLPRTLPGKKLPIWTRRIIPTSAQTSNSFSDFDRPIRIITTAVDQTPRPTRFEWPDDGDDDAPGSPLAFEDISYESKPLMQLKEPTFKREPVHTISRTPPQPPVTTQKQRTATFEEVLRTGAVVKRMAPSQLVTDSAKKCKMLDLQAVKEYVQETQVRKHMLDKEESDEDVDNDLSTMDHDYYDDDDTPVTPTLTPHKSILKQTSHDEEMVNTSSKKVRFSLDPETSPAEEKENSTSVTAEVGNNTVAKVATPLPTRATTNQSPGTVTTTSTTNHAKIITEVLKKYPHLVKNNKNIRLKIMQRGGIGSQLITLDKDASGKQQTKSKVSYVVLKSDTLGAKGKPAFGIKQQGGVVEQLSTFESQSKPASGAENTSGPWLCHTCGTKEEAMNFATYYLYRHHLQNVHNEKIDARICEHCGHRASKRNLLLYHMFTKHGVAPPRNCQFPKCDQCEYIALSESLLVKHRNNHSNNRDYVCKVCNATFKSNGALLGHMQTNLHSDPYKKNLYECPFCQKPFIRNINLKAHIRASHKELAKQLPPDDDLDLEDGMGDEILEEGEGVMEVPVINVLNENSSGMTIIAEAPASFEPSSEAEGLSHVASGIATSLGLTDGQQAVILLDENEQEYIIHTTEIVGNEFVQEQEYIQDQELQQVQEYIVPEMMNEAQTAPEDEEMEEYTEEQPVHGTEEVLMVLTDHCYAEEIITKEEVRDLPREAHTTLTDDNGQAPESIEKEPNNDAIGDTNSEDKKPVDKIGKPIDDLMDDWGDEELNEEINNPSHSAIGQDALPTRGELPEHLYKVERPVPTRETLESELEDRLFKETEELLRTDLQPKLLAEDNSQESGELTSDNEQFVQDDTDESSQLMEREESAPLSVEMRSSSSFPNEIGVNGTFDQDSEQENPLSQEEESSLTFTQKEEGSNSFNQATEQSSFSNVDELGQSFPQTHESTSFSEETDQIKIPTFPQESDQLSSFTQGMEENRSGYKGTPFDVTGQSTLMLEEDRSTVFLASNDNTSYVEAQQSNALTATSEAQPFGETETGTPFEGVNESIPNSSYIEPSPSEANGDNTSLGIKAELVSIQTPETNGGEQPSQ